MVQVLEMKDRLKNAKVLGVQKPWPSYRSSLLSPSSEMLFSADALFHITISHLTHDDDDDDDKNRASSKK
jgi:hypothetical protein